MSLRRTIISWATGAAVLTGTLAAVAAPASPAFAICDAPRVVYTFTDDTRTSLPSNVYTYWLQGPGSITMNFTKTTTVNASLTATVSAEAGVIFAKASTSLGVTVGKSWSKSTSFSVTKSVPKNKEGRLRAYHDAVKFKVTKKTLMSPCNYRTQYTSWVTAPEKGGDTVVKLNLRALGAASAQSLDQDPVDEVQQDAAVYPNDEGVLSND